MTVLRLLRAAIPAVLPLSATATLLAQDVLQVAPQRYQVRVDNEHVRVGENTLAPGGRPRAYPSRRLVLVEVKCAASRPSAGTVSYTHLTLPTKRIV